MWWTLYTLNNNYYHCQKKKKSQLLSVSHSFTYSVHSKYKGANPHTIIIGFISFKGNEGVIIHGLADSSSYPVCTAQDYLHKYFQAYSTYRWFGQIFEMSDWMRSFHLSIGTLIPYDYFIDFSLYHMPEYSSHALLWFALLLLFMNFWPATNAK